MPALAATRSARKIPALDGVRGLAIALVLFYHFTMGIAPGGPVSRLIVKLGSFGWAGVDLFFVLSGYLITGILDDARIRACLDSRSKPGVFRGFYARRIRRVFPLYFGTLFILWLIGEPPGFEGLNATTLWNGTFLTNNLVAIRGAWFPLSHFWSLAVEEHFYLFWPLVVVLGGRRFALGLTGLMLMVSLASRVYLVSQGGTLGAYVLTICRVDSLAIGGALAFYLRSETSPVLSLQTARRIGSLAALALFVLILWRRGLPFHDPVVQIVGYPLLAILASVLIAYLVLTTENTSNWLTLGFQTYLARSLGRYSFGLYVFNSIAILVLDGWETRGALLRQTGSPFLSDAGYAMIGLALTLSAAWLSWHLIEAPILNGRAPWSWKAIPGFPAVREQPFALSKVS